MTKPLELTWYERDEDGDYAHPDGYFIPEMDVDDWNEWKRLTDAELAAEYWSERTRFERMGFNELACGEDWGDEAWDRLAAPANTLHRFATRQHASESAYQ